MTKFVGNGKFLAIRCIQIVHNNLAGFQIYETCNIPIFREISISNVKAIIAYNRKNIDRRRSDIILLQHFVCTLLCKFIIWLVCLPLTV